MVGRAGIGLDNVDVAAATRRGVMVVNAPQSNVLSAAEHTMALLLAQARNIPQAHAALIAGRWERSRWEGVELHGKVLGVVGLGRVGTLVAQRALAFGMRLLAYDPYVSAERAKQLGVELLPLAELVAGCRLPDHPPAEDPGDLGTRSAPTCWPGPKPGLRIVNTARGGIIDEKALAQAIADGTVAGAALDVFEHEPVSGVAALRAGPGGGHPASGGQHPGGPGQGRGDDRRAGAAGPGRASSFPWRSTSPRPRCPRPSGPGCRWPNGWAGSGRPWPGSFPPSSTSSSRAAWPSTTPGSFPWPCSRASSR